MILAPEGSQIELEALQSEYAGVAGTLASARWEDLKAASRTRWRPQISGARPDRYETLARLALMDRVKAAAATAESLRARLAKGTERTGKYSRELVGRLALQLHLLKEGIKDVMETAPIEVALVVEPAFERPSENEATRRWCVQLLGMYRAWAGNRHMQLAEIAGGTPRDLPWLLISGFGAHRLLAQEIGLHVLELADEEKGSSRAAARVRLAIAPLGDLPADKFRAVLCRSAWSRAAAARGRAPLPQRAVAARAQHERQLAHGQARRRAARRLRPDRRQPGIGGFLSPFFTGRGLG